MRLPQAILLALAVLVTAGAFFWATHKPTSHPAPPHTSAEPTLIASSHPAPWSQRLRSSTPEEQPAIIATLTREDPHATYQTLQEAFPHGIPSRLLEAHYFNWPAHAIAALDSRIDALPAGPERKLALFSRVVSTCATDPAATWDFYRQAAKTDIDDECLARIAATGSATAPTSLTLIAQLRPFFSHDERWTHLAATALAENLRQSPDPVTALNWINQTVPPDHSAADTLVAEVIGQLNQHAPDKARALLQALNDPELTRQFSPQPEPTRSE